MRERERVTYTLCIGHCAEAAVAASWSEQLVPGRSLVVCSRAVGSELLTAARERHSCRSATRYTDTGKGNATVLCLPPEDLFHCFLSSIRVFHTAFTHILFRARGRRAKPRTVATHSLSRHSNNSQSLQRALDWAIWCFDCCGTTPSLTTTRSASMLLMAGKQRRETQRDGEKRANSFSCHSLCASNDSFSLLQT